MGSSPCTEEEASIRVEKKERNILISTAEKSSTLSQSSESKKSLNSLICLNCQELSEYRDTKDKSKLI